MQCLRACFEVCVRVCVRACGRVCTLKVDHLEFLLHDFNMFWFMLGYGRNSGSPWFYLGIYIAINMGVSITMLTRELYGRLISLEAARVRAWLGYSSNIDSIKYWPNNLCCCGIILVVCMLFFDSESVFGLAVGRTLRADVVFRHNSTWPHSKSFLQGYLHH